VDGLPSAYWFLWAGALINRLGSFVVPFLALYLTEIRGLSPGEAGVVVSTWGLGSLGAGPVGGLLADRWGRRRTLVLSLSAGAAAMATLGFARGIPHIVAASFTLGFFGEMYRPSVQAAIGDLVPEADRTRAFGFLYWAINLGFSISPVVAGFMAKRSFTALFVGDAATTLAFAAIVRARVPETHPSASLQNTPDSARVTDAGPKRWTAPYTDRVFLAFVGVSFLTAMVFVQHLVGLPLDMSAHGIDAQRYGTLICTNGILIVLVQPSAAVWLARFPLSRVVAVGSFLVGVGFGLTGLVHTPLGYAGSIAVWSLGEIALLPVAAVMITELAPPSLRGSYQGLYQLTWGAAFSVAPSLSGAVIARFGAHALWAGCFVIGSFVALAHLAAEPARLRRREQLQRL
jgi:MFS family permease